MYISPVQRERHRQTKSLPKNIDKMMHVIEKTDYVLSSSLSAFFVPATFHLLNISLVYARNKIVKLLIAVYRETYTFVCMCVCVCVCVNYLTVSCELLLKCHQQQLHSGSLLKVKCVAAHLDTLDNKNNVKID